MINRVCIEPECYLYKIPRLCTRENFFRGHVMKKSTEKVIEILKDIGLVVPFDLLGRYTILNIFTDLCKETVANEIINRVDSND